MVNSSNEYKVRFYGQMIEPLIKHKNPMILLENTVYGSNYDRGIKIFEKNKLFGVGINNFRIESGKEIYENKNLIFNDINAKKEIIAVKIILPVPGSRYAYALDNNEKK